MFNSGMTCISEPNRHNQADRMDRGMLLRFWGGAPHVLSETSPTQDSGRVSHCSNQKAGGWNT